MNRALILASMVLVMFGFIIQILIGIYSMPRETPREGIFPPPLQIQDLVFISKLNKTSNKSTITLSISIKNIYDSPIIVKSIWIPDANWYIELNIRLNPGQVYLGEWIILRNVPVNGSWRVNSSHLVKITYEIPEIESTLSVSEKGYVIAYGLRRK